MDDSIVPGGRDLLLEIAQKLQQVQRQTNVAGDGLAQIITAEREARAIRELQTHGISPASFAVVGRATYGLLGASVWGYLDVTDHLFVGDERTTGKELRFIFGRVSEACPTPARAPLPTNLRELIERYSPLMRPEVIEGFRELGERMSVQEAQELSKHYPSLDIYLPNLGQEESRFLSFFGALRKEMTAESVNLLHEIAQFHGLPGLLGPTMRGKTVLETLVEQSSSVGHGDPQYQNIDLYHQRLQATDPLARNLIASYFDKVMGDGVVDDSEKEMLTLFTSLYTSGFLPPNVVSPFVPVIDRYSVFDLLDAERIFQDAVVSELYLSLNDPRISTRSCAMYEDATSRYSSEIADPASQQNWNGLFLSILAPLTNPFQLTENALQECRRHNTDFDSRISAATQFWNDQYGEDFLGSVVDRTIRGLWSFLLEVRYANRIWGDNRSESEPLLGYSARLHGLREPIFTSEYREIVGER